MATRLSGWSDEELAARVAADGNEEACTEIFHRYQRRIYLWCFGYTHDGDEAMDLTQEVFIRVFRGIEEFAGRSRFSTWVYTIARNHCANAVVRRRDRGSRAVPIESIEFEDPHWSEVRRRADLAGEVESLLARAGEKVPEDELTAFVLHYRDGLTVNEITRTLRCANVTGARTLIQNARRKLNRLVAGKEGSGD